METSRLGKAFACVREAGAVLRAPRLGKLVDEPADAARLDLGDRDELAAAGAAALPARDGPPLGVRPLLGQDDDAVRDLLKDGQERFQPRGRRREAQLHLDLVVPDLHSNANGHLTHGSRPLRPNV